MTAGGPLKWQSASTAEGEGGSRNSEGGEGGALADHGARMVQGGLHHAGIGGGILQDRELATVGDVPLKAIAGREVAT